MLNPDHPDLFSGPVEDSHIRALTVPADPAPAARVLDQTIAHHEHIRREWLDRVRRAMVALWFERQRANEDRHYGTLGTYVTADDASAFLEKVGYEGKETRWLANVFVQPRGLWVRVGDTKSTRRHCARIPRWSLNEECPADIALRYGL